MTDVDLKMMRRAISLARRGSGKTSPNPAVGCVIVKDGVIVGEGWHKKAGTPHAEVHALAAVGDRAKGAHVYVTLEPCSHFGKTPPCADALIAASVAKVFVGMIDPNPLVSGKGVERLLTAGISVESGLLEAQCRLLNEAFCKHVTSGLPFVTHKGAMTLDGRTATISGDSRWISSPSSRRLVHQLRSKADCVMVGSGTLLADDPELTVRMVKGPSPLRVVVDSRMQTPVDCRLMQEAATVPVIIATISRDQGKIAALEAKGAEIMICRERDGRVDLHDLLASLGGRGIQSILLEGGETLAGEMLRQGLIDRFLFFLAPKLLGGCGKGLFAGDCSGKMADAIPVRIERIRHVGPDILIEACPEGKCLQD
jgi:diaminohydroxyphosphoribosylaminopyrimidine deaminase/5-amino-6-(5-phosphoribosylamino)uracil reductase